MDELATFKAAVPLRAFAESIGYVLDRAKSCLRKDPPVYSLTRDSDRIMGVFKQTTPKSHRIRSIY